MRLPSVKDSPVEGKKVLLRVDFDIPLNPLDTKRIEKSLPTIKYLLEKKAKIIIISHLGRPGGKVVPELSLEPVVEKITNYKLQITNKFQISNIKLGNFNGWKLSDSLWLLENLRFYPEEEKNDIDFAKKLANLADFYINDAFAVSHREHASIVGVPKFLPADKRAFGLSFIEEVEVLSKIRNNPERPVVLILGGAKDDKLDQINKLAQWADWILVGGKLPVLVKGLKFKVKSLIVAELNEEGKDITLETAEEFKKIIQQSRTVVWAGPMGVFEEEKFATGTREIAQAIIENKSFSVVGGGDTQAALKKLGFDGKMSYISSGGGAMLEFLAKGTLPGIKAAISKDNRMTR